MSTEYFNPIKDFIGDYGPLSIFRSTMISVLKSFVIIIACI